MNKIALKIVYIVVMMASFVLGIKFILMFIDGSNTTDLFIGVTLSGLFLFLLLNFVIENNTNLYTPDDNDDI